MSLPLQATFLLEDIYEVVRQLHNHDHRTLQTDYSLDSATADGVSSGVGAPGSRDKILNVKCHINQVRENKRSTIKRPIGEGGGAKPATRQVEN